MINKSPALYQQIYDDIKLKILDNVLIPGQKIPTEFEIVDSYSVSRITASRALSDLARDGYITRLPKKGSIVNDLVGRYENYKKDQNYNIVPLIMPFSPDVGFDLFSSIQSSFGNKAIILLNNSEKDIKKEREILENISRMNISGVICFPIEGNENVSYFAHFLYKKIPLVFIDRPLPCISLPYVGTDNFKCMYRFTEWLIQKGHRDIAFFATSLSISNEKMRFSGYLKALIDNGIEVRKEFINELHHDAPTSEMLVDNSSFTAEKARSVLSKIINLKNPPTALMCVNDTLASYVINQASSLGISIPNDLSVTGFDNLNICDLLSVPLTTFAQDYKRIGQKAVELIKNKTVSFKSSDSYLFDGEIIERASVLDKTL